MSEKNKKQEEKRKTITFQPDEDVRQMLEEFVKVYGEPYGFTSLLVNESVRKALPGIVEDWARKLRDLADKKGRRPDKT